jgi:hypothetical protein
MKAIDLYKFITKYDIEHHWHNEDVILMVNNMYIEEFHKLLSSSIFDEDGLSCVMKDGYFCFYMEQICNHFDIELTDIFERFK